MNFSPGSSTNESIVSKAASTEPRPRVIERKAYRKEYNAAVEHLSTEEKVEAQNFQRDITNLVKLRDHTAAVSHDDLATLKGLQRSQLWGREKTSDTPA